MSNRGPGLIFPFPILIMFFVIIMSNNARNARHRSEARSATSSAHEPEPCYEYASLPDGTKLGKIGAKWFITTPDGKPASEHGYHEITSLADGTKIGTRGGCSYFINEVGAPVSLGFHTITATPVGEEEGYNATLGVWKFKLNKSGEIIGGDKYPEGESTTAESNPR